jgi:hypothetical protein
LLTIEELHSLPERLDDAALALVSDTASIMLPELPPCEPGYLAECLQLLAEMPRSKAGRQSGELQVLAFKRVLRGFPKRAITFLVDEALKGAHGSKFLPSTVECLAILEKWKRNDPAALAKRHAQLLAIRERQARFDDAMTRLAAGEASQAEIDAMPEQWKSVGETRSYLWRHEDGSYSARVRREAAA